MIRLGAIMENEETSRSIEEAFKIESKNNGKLLFDDIFCSKSEHIPKPEHKINGVNWRGNVTKNSLSKALKAIGYGSKHGLKYGIGKTPKWFLKGFVWKEFKGPSNTEWFSSKYQTKLLLNILRYFMPNQDPLTYYENYPEEED